jgi:hypothetical protein
MSEMNACFTAIGAHSQSFFAKTYIYMAYICVKYNIGDTKIIYLCLQYFTTAVGYIFDLRGRPDASGEPAASIFRLT